MKKLFFVVMVISLLMVSACGGSNDPKVVMNDYLSAIENYCTDLGKAGSADDVVAALNTATAKMKDVMPRIKELIKKYPEIKNMQKGAKLPEVFKDFEQRVAEIGPKIFGSMANAWKYMQDPKVVEANKKFTDLMSEMQ